MISVHMYSGRSNRPSPISLQILYNTTSRWSARIVVDIGYGIDIGDDDSYVTLAKRVAEYFSLGVEPFRWFVDIFPIRAQFQLQNASW